jgi:hypothetical protein
MSQAATNLRLVRTTADIGLIVRVENKYKFAHKPYVV